jgi:hypothetical protein
VFSTGSVFYKAEPKLDRAEPKLDRLRTLNLKINYLIGFFIMSGLSDPVPFKGAECTIYAGRAPYPLR